MVCEKCWADAYMRSRYSGETQSECYFKILKEREDNPCTPQEQAGDYWDNDLKCDSRFIK